MKTRRRFLLASTLGMFVPHVLAQKRMPRVCMLNPRSLSQSLVSRPVVDALAARGYRAGKEMMLEYRSSEGDASEEKRLVHELLGLNCDLIFALSTEISAQAFRDARSRVPIVLFAVDYDPLQKRIIDSLARPGGNITGVYGPILTSGPKKLEIALDVLPAAKRFLVVSDRDSKDQLESLKSAAASRSVDLMVVEYEKQPYDFAAAFARAREARVDGFIGLSSPGLGRWRKALGELFIKYRMPAFVGRLSMVEPGFLVGHTSDLAKIARRTADIGIRILNGARPGDIPFEQADEFETVVNMKTAKMIGVTIPPTVLARATKVIE
ncbi:MAG TPA: ABC transporter substrate-binding protein [Burkholderiales bacterium]|jgi:putative ABC transport system substrate-binding protein